MFAAARRKERGIGSHSAAHAGRHSDRGAGAHPAPQRLSAAAYGAIWVVKGVRGSRAFEANKRWPLDLPIDAPGGKYMPPIALEAVAASEEEIRSYLINPRSGVFKDTRVVALDHERFEITGTVEALNDFGTTVEAPWAIEAMKTKGVQMASEGDRRVYQDWEEWAFSFHHLGLSGHGTVWKGGVFQAPVPGSGPGSPLNRRGTPEEVKRPRR
jgi:hypothetical protein